MHIPERDINCFVSDTLPKSKGKVDTVFKYEAYTSELTNLHSGGSCTYKLEMMQVHEVFELLH